MNVDEKTIAVVITAGAVLCTALYNYYLNQPEVKELPEIAAVVYVDDPSKVWTVPTGGVGGLDLDLPDLQVTVDTLYILEWWNPPTLILGLASNLVVVFFYGNMHLYLLNCFPMSSSMETWDNGFLEECKKYAEVQVSRGMKPSFQIDFTCKEYTPKPMDFSGECKVKVLDQDKLVLKPIFDRQKH
jgi:hypothetical protein